MGLSENELGTNLSTPPRGVSIKEMKWWIRTLSTLRNNTLAGLIAIAQRYGDFYCGSLGGLRIILLNHPDMVQWVLQRNYRHYSKDTFQYNLLRMVTGNGLLTNDGESWLRQRRLVQPAFHRSQIAAMARVMMNTIQSMLDRWEVIAQHGTPINVDEEMMRLSFEIVAKAFFGVDLSHQAEQLTQATLSVLDVIVHRARNPFSLPTWVPTAQSRRFRAALRTLDATVYRLIRQRQKERRAGGDRTSRVAGSEAVNPEKELRYDLLDMLLDATDDHTDAPLNERQIRDEIVTMLIAGHETVASAMTWTLYLLAKYSHVTESLRQQIQSLFGRHQPEPNSLGAIPLLRWTFQEALRLYPPAWLITRKALQEDEIAGLVIPPGSLVVISPYILHRHPHFWQDPQTFDPERFSEERSSARPHFAYIPFGGGPRLCIGDAFATLEAQLVLAAILQRFRLRLVSESEVIPEPSVTLRPRGGMWMVLQRVD